MNLLPLPPLLPSSRLPISPISLPPPPKSSRALPILTLLYPSFSPFQAFVPPSKHTVHYDDGDIETLHLARQKWQLLISPDGLGADIGHGTYPTMTNPAHGTAKGGGQHRHGAAARSGGAGGVEGLDLGAGGSASSQQGKGGAITPRAGKPKGAAGGAAGGDGGRRRSASGDAAAAAGIAGGVGAGTAAVQRQIMSLSPNRPAAGGASSGAFGQGAITTAVEGAPRGWASGPQTSSGVGTVGGAGGGGGGSLRQLLLQQRLAAVAAGEPGLGFDWGVGAGTGGEALIMMQQLQRQQQLQQQQEKLRQQQQQMYPQQQQQLQRVMSGATPSSGLLPPPASLLPGSPAAPHPQVPGQLPGFSNSISNPLSPAASGQLLQGQGQGGAAGPPIRYPSMGASAGGPALDSFMLDAGSKDSAHQLLGPSSPPAGQPAASPLVTTTGMPSRQVGGAGAAGAAGGGGGGAGMQQLTHRSHQQQQQQQQLMRSRQEAALQQQQQQRGAALVSQPPPTVPVMCGGVRGSLIMRTCQIACHCQGCAAQHSATLRPQVFLPSDFERHAGGSVHIIRKEMV